MVSQRARSQSTELRLNPKRPLSGLSPKTGQLPPNQRPTFTLNLNMDSLRRAEGPSPRSAGEKTLSAAEGSTQRMASAPKSGSIARSERPGQFLITMLACSALALVALGLASPVSASFSAERADARAILAKFSNSGPRSPDGCATGCGMIMDAFASGYCGLKAVLVRISAARQSDSSSLAALSLNVCSRQ